MDTFDMFASVGCFAGLFAFLHFSKYLANTISEKDTNNIQRKYVRKCTYITKLSSFALHEYVHWSGE